MQALRMISGLVFLIRPLCALSRLLARPFAAIVRYARPTTALTRLCYVGLGGALLLGALGAEQDGQRNYAIALAAAGVILLILRRIGKPIKQGKPIKDDGEAQMPSDLLKSGWTRKGVAANGRGEPALSDDPAAVAWSLCGAVNAVYEADSALWKSYMAALRAQVGHNLVRWNGDSGRTQDDVVAVALEAEKIVKAPS